jgi:hypothetical protein
MKHVTKQANCIMQKPIRHLACIDLGCQRINFVFKNDAFTLYVRQMTYGLIGKVQKS